MKPKEAGALPCAPFLPIWTFPGLPRHGRHGLVTLLASLGHPDAFVPALINADFIAWKSRAILCEGCDYDKYNPMPLSAVENKKSAIHEHLTVGHHIFNAFHMKQFDIEPEPMIWKAEERISCQGSWWDRKLCKSTRDYMTNILDLQFVSRRMRWLQGQEEEICKLRNDRGLWKKVTKRTTDQRIFNTIVDIGLKGPQHHQKVFP